MYWGEKIVRNGLRFAQADFNRHFTDWSEVLKTLEERFIFRCDSNSHFSNGSEQFKSRITIRAINQKNIASEIDGLENDCNYWVVFVHGDYPTAKQVVYDCKPIVIKAPSEIISGHFFIGDKKYNGLSNFIR